MADWKNNKILGIAAGVVVVLSIVILISALAGRRKSGLTITPEMQAAADKDMEAMSRSRY